MGKLEKQEQEKKYVKNAKTTGKKLEQTGKHAKNGGNRKTHGKSGRIIVIIAKLFFLAIGYLDISLCTYTKKKTF